MNCKYEVQSFDWEMTAFEHSHLKCSHCPESKLLNINFSLFFCKMCRTYLSREERLNTCVSCHAIMTNSMVFDKRGFILKKIQLLHFGSQTLVELHAK